MKHLLDLFPVAAGRVTPPVLIALGSPWPVTQLVGALGGVETVCFQMDVYVAARLREKLAQEGLTAEVVTGPDLWDLPARFRTVLFPAAAHADRELKLDMVEQGFHVLEEGGMFISLSEYEKDTLFAKWHKKVFGKCGESPKSKNGMAFWSAKQGDQPRRRHEITFHAKINDGASMSFASWPGTFGYGRMDSGSRAMLEVVQLQPGAHILDLGCGNGTVGCLASPGAGPEGHVTFIDSNARATALSELNAKANCVSNYKVITSATLQGLEPVGYDAVLANPPYYANSEVARMFISSSRDLLKTGGKFYLVSKMPVQTIPEVVETYGDVEAIENRGYTVLIAQG
ncbi:class I SAM-dependent methyltransferase [Fimbriiglobus ruber]|uniref:Ribosomal RNA small subunit methyltransferase C n=1 Tax=Fimbriiglobus ruber TaxID=1908690 RepID=A0A225DDR4_9BACT|nr:methyltransferase [Fimbriiglobus ruber]OWK36658.1 Ribosomal RNA small subunit methyltransferase C [Fimbriiglobus ruber]